MTADTAGDSQTDLEAKGCPFACPDEESVVIGRASRWETKDPFPEVEPALLSAVEIQNYARVTGLIHPYDDEKLKAASYPAGMGGLFVRWDDGKKIEFKIADVQSVTLPPNSISFVQTDVTFRLPHYIAMRFNLQISHVHRGILLGTGPVVDPGFQGRLLIPLHNLTSTDYIIPVSECLIWVEFTKTTFRRPPPPPPYDSSKWEDYLFPPGKRNQSPDQYFRRANDLNPIESSIPLAIARSKEDARNSAEAAQKARTSAEKSESSSRQARNWIIGLGLFGALSVVIGILTIYFQAVGVMQDAATIAREAKEQLNQIQRDDAGSASQLQQQRQPEPKTRTPPPSATPR